MYKINFTETYLKLSLLKIYARLTITSNNISKAMRHSSKKLLYVISNIISKVTYHLLSNFLYSRLPVKLLITVLILLIGWRIEQFRSVVHLRDLLHRSIPRRGPRRQRPRQLLHLRPRRHAQRPQKSGFP